MFRVILAAAAILVAPAPASAADKLLKGPPAAWVKPIEVKPVPASEDGPSVRVLLEDHQLYLGPDGQSEYVESAVQVRTPLGLASAGSMGIAWDPATDTVTVHHLRILRGDETIDVLAKQDFTVIRRETNLNRAMLDGRLTATLQPEGLQAGDVVQLAYTRTHLDPVMKGRLDYVIQASPFARAERLRLRALWDANLDLAWTSGKGLDKPKVGKSGGRTEVTVEMKDVQPVKFPAGAPQRFWPTRELAVSDFKSWADVASLMAPLFEKAAVLAPDSPLRPEVERIRKASADPKVRAGLALQLVEDQIRYLAVTMQNGGYVPQSPEESWRLRYGDCKAKTVLLMALLRELGIEAEAAVVDSDGGEFLAARPPGVTHFDHVIVRAVLGGRTYWLDGTRMGDRNIDAVRTPPFGQALPLRATGSQLVSLMQPPRDAPDSGVLLRVDVTKGLDAPAPVHGEMTMSGDMGTYFALGAKAAAPADREKALKAFWRMYSWIEPKTVALIQDGETGEARVVMDGEAKLPWVPPYATIRMLPIPGAQLGWRSEFKRDPPGPGDDAPWVVAGYPSYSVNRFEIVLPSGGEGFSTLGDDVDVKVAGRHFTRKITLEKGVARFVTATQVLAPEFPASEAPAAKEKLEALSKVRVGLRAPSTYRPTAADVEAYRALTPKTADELVGRANRFLTADRRDLAMADLTKALELDPKSAFAYANRGVVHLHAGERDLARADFAKALELDPRNWVALQNQGVIALTEAHYPEAIASLTRAIDIAPNNMFALDRRVEAYRGMGKTDEALADLAQMERLEPGRVQTQVLRFGVYRDLHKPEQALAELDKAIARSPDDARLHLYRGGLLATMDRPAEADAAFARSIAIRPSAEAYLTRAFHHRDAPFAEQMADIQAAEKAEPGSVLVVMRKADLLADARRFDEALAELNRTLKAHPDDMGVIDTRATVAARAGRTAQATADFALLRSKATGSASAYNNLCWSQAVLPFDLPNALADCDKALAINPKFAHALDSRAFVLLRMGRLPDALAAYEEALRQRPDWPDTILGRGLTRQRMGQTAEGQADIDVALKVEPRLARTWAEFGIEVAPTPPAKAVAAEAAPAAVR